MRRPRLSFLAIGAIATAVLFAACNARDPSPGGAGSPGPVVGTARDALVWAQVQGPILSPFIYNLQLFGNDVDISALPDGGGRFIAAAPTTGKTTPAGPSNSRDGQVWVYYRAPGAPTYVYEDQLFGSFITDWDQFGSAVAIQGDRAVVSSTVHWAEPPHKYCDNIGLGTTNVTCTSGTAYIFERQPVTPPTIPPTLKWKQVAQLYPSDIAAGMYFGQAVALDGDRVVVSAYKSDQLSPHLNDNGSVYVFERLPDGTWPVTETTRIVASDRVDDSAKFGNSIALKGDQLVVGAYNSNKVGFTAGAAYVYEHQSDGSWKESKLVASNPCPKDWYGTSVSIESNRAIISSRDAEENRNPDCSLIAGPDGGVPISDSGLAYIVEKQSDGSWKQTAILAPPDPSLDLRFGVNVAISGSTAMVGAFNDNDAGYQVGSAYVYHYCAANDDQLTYAVGSKTYATYPECQSVPVGTWGLQKQIYPKPPQANMAFGTAVALDGNQSIVGAFRYGTADYPTEAGAVYTYESATELANGTKCINNNGSYCASGFCADGVCCDGACTGSCESCLGAKTGKTDGTCQPIPADQDPDNECPANDPATCGPDGFCDGTRECRPNYILGTPCGTTVCAASIQTGRSCNGGGSCKDDPVSCTTYQCNGEKTACLTKCTKDAECAANAYCDPTDSHCKTHLNDGTACTRDGECANSHCADGVCCNTACNGQCEACAAPTGVCNAVTGAPKTGHPTCIATTAVCGGTCDGSNRAACNYPGGAVACGASRCDSGSTTPQQCDSNGACVDGTAIDCQPYTCGGTECRTDCAVDDDCTTGFICQNAACVPATTGRCNQQPIGKLPPNTVALDSTGAVVKDCTPFLCTNGVCGEKCSNASDCQTTYVCNRQKGTCVKAKAPPLSVDVGGCSIEKSTTRNGARDSTLGWAGFLAVASIGRRVRRDRRRVLGPR